MYAVVWGGGVTWFRLAVEGPFETTGKVHFRFCSVFDNLCIH